MTKNMRVFALVLALLLVAGMFAGCQGGQNGGTTTAPTTAPVPNVDYVSDLKLDMNSSTFKLEVTVKSYIDGDTTHFHVPKDVSPDGVLKARYLCVNTPESTGKIEPWGKKASNFTKEKLKGADSIIIESNDEKLNADSTGGRYLLWIWYRTAGTQEYRNLNLELVQNGLSITGGNVNERYGDQTMQAYMQAKAQKLNCHSGKNDPDFYYGEAYEVDLKGLRTNISLYEGKLVAFEGVITRYNANTAYVESYDEESGLYYGVTVYCGYPKGVLADTMSGIGNLVRVVGTVTYYEAGGTWQVSGIDFNEFKPEKPENTILVSSGHAAGYQELDAETFLNGKVEVEVFESLEDEEGTTTQKNYADMIMSSSVSMKNLKVVDIYTTSNGGDNDGAMTLTCQVDGKTITVRTIVLRNADGEMMTESDYMGKTIDVVGNVDYFSGDYQIKVFHVNDITVHE